MPNGGQYPIDDSDVVNPCNPNNKASLKSPQMVWKYHPQIVAMYC